MWLVGVVVRRYIDILIIIINFPYSTCIMSFFGSSILTSLFILKKKFFGLVSVIFLQYIANVTHRTFEIVQKTRTREYKNYLIGEQSEPHTYRTAEKNIRHIYIYIYMFFIYIYIYIYIYVYIYTFVRRARAVHARATRKRRTGRLRFNGQYNRLKNGYFSSKL